MKQENYFSLSQYNQERNEDFLFNLSGTNTDWFIDKDNNSIIKDDISLNQDPNFNNLNLECNSYEAQIEEKFCKNFLIKEEDEKVSSLLSHKRINESNFEENRELKKEFPEKIKILTEPIKIEQKNTKESTGESSKIKMIKKKYLFEQNKKIFRNDYYIKKFKVECFSNYATNKLNALLKSCEFPKRLNLTKIYMPNNKTFTSIANLKKNKLFLPRSIRDIFSMQNGEGQYQEKNALNFRRISNSRNEAGNIEAYENLEEYLNMTIENAIIDYYNSEEFEKFKANEEIIEYDRAFYQEKKFSILEDFGFLRLIKGNY